MATMQVADREFRKQVLQSDKPTLIAFRASWCLPSQDLAPIIDEIATEFDDRVRVVIVEAAEDTVVIRRRFKVNRFPVTMLVVNGRCVDLIGGMTSKDQIVQMIETGFKPVLRVDEMTFDAEVLQSHVPVLVHFDAAWCSASQSLIPILDQVAEKFKDRAKVVRVNFGPDTAAMCSRWRVYRVPTLALFVDGQIEDQILGGLVGGTKVGGELSSCVGLTSLENISEMLERFTP